MEHLRDRANSLQASCKPLSDESLKPVRQRLEDSQHAVCVKFKSMVGHHDTKSAEALLSSYREALPPRVVDAMANILATFGAMVEARGYRKGVQDFFPCRPLKAAVEVLALAGVSSGNGEEALQDVPEGQRAALIATWESFSAELKHVREELNSWRDEAQQILRKRTPPGIPGCVDDPMAKSDIEVFKSWTRKLEAGCVMQRACVCGHVRCRCPC